MVERKSFLQAANAPAWMTGEIWKTDEEKIGADCLQKA